MAQIKLKKIKASAESRKFATEVTGSRNLPTLYVDDTQIPEIKDWEVGKTYRVLVELTQVGKNSMSVGGGDEVIDARFNIVAYKPIEMEKDLDEMTDEEFGEKQAEEYGKK